MRHGRKSRSKRLDGYKEHIARDLGLPVIVACAVTPANRPEEEGAAPIAKDIERQQLRSAELHIDRAYVNRPVVDDVIRAKGKVFSRPWGSGLAAPTCSASATSRLTCAPRR
ncbi:MULTISPECIES: transposase [Sorangium]|uniref:transposase n=1 Tax=Sorangium TaxID=39643 RepID=UPI001EEDFAC5|nr:MULTISPECIES: transposase [Sorangium]